MRGSVKRALKDGQKRSSAKTGEPMWRLQFDVGKPDERKVKVRSFIGTEKEAVKELRRLIAVFESQTIDDNNLSVAAMLDLWLEDIKPVFSNGVCVTAISQRTWERYKQTSRVNLKPLFGTTALQELQRRVIEKSFKSLLKTDDNQSAKGKLSPKSIKNIHGVLSCALKWAYREELVDTVATTGVRLPKVIKREINIYTREECAQLVTALKGHWLQPIVIVAMQTGMRLGEILALNWRHIDFEKKRLTVDSALSTTRERGSFIKDPKTAAGRRHIALSEITCATLRKVQLDQAERNLAFEIRQNDGAVFDSFAIDGKCSGEYCKTWQISNAFSRNLKRLKLKKLRFHDLRHTHLSQLIADGEAITTIAARAGHSNPHTTLTVYSHLIPNEDQAMMDRFDEKHLFSAVNS